MKKSFYISAIMLLVGTTAINSQTNKFIGTWQGTLDIGMELRVVFHIKDAGNGTLTSSADSPDQSAYGLKCDTTIVNGENIKIELRDLGASFNGKLVNDSTIDGVFVQSTDLPLSLKKTSRSLPPKRKRPQTPQQPFPYKSEDVTYDNKERSLHYGATITIPEGKGPFPALILITGSGAQNRDEEIMGHKPFWIIADYLTRKGFIVLRVDDRGIGKSTGKFTEATTADFAKDVHTGLDYLLSRPEVDKKKLGMIGHSEGGMIAPMVAAARKDIDFIVLLAGPGVPILGLMAEQNAAFLRSGNSGIDEIAITSYLILYKEIVTRILRDTSNAKPEAEKTLKDWIARTDSGIVKQIGLSSPDAQKNYANSMAETISSPWYMYFVSFDPGPYLEKLKCKVLALNGEKDIQVISKQNLPAIEASLKKSKVKIYSVREVPGQNHLFQTCKKCTVNEYGELEETFSPVTLEIMGEWLGKNVK